VWLADVALPRLSWAMAAHTKTRATDTRDRLIDAALVVCAREGLAAANVKAIAREAGVTAGLLHYHFPSKDEALFAAVERAGQDYLASLDTLLEECAPETIFEDYFKFARQSLTAHRPLFALRLALAVRAINEPDTAGRLARGDAEISRRIATIVARSLGREKVTEQDSLDARMIKAAFEGLMLAWLSRPDFPMESAFARFAEQFRNQQC
jgi:AcrR family transcriptional regulator